MIYQFTVYPIECFYKGLYLALSEVSGNNYGLALIFLSLIIYALMSPLMSYAEKFQAAEKNIQAVLAPQLADIKENFSGAEQHKKIQRLYKRYAYHPVLAIRSVAGIILQLPFLMAAYFMLDNLSDIIGQSWWLIADLSQPDELLGGVNFLPILMTAINLVGTFSVKTFSRREKIQASVVAILFLILLYDAPSALLIYWTCNNLWTTVAILFSQSVPKNFLSAQARLKKFLSSEIIPLGFSLTLCTFIPLDIYLTNTEEVPQMLTGKAYDNSQPYSDYIKEAWDSSKGFYDILLKHDYDISIYDTFLYISKNAPIDNMLTKEKRLRVNHYTLTALAKLTLFRCLPNYLKQSFIIESSELWKQEEISGEIQPYSDNNFFVYSYLQKGLTLHDRKRFFDRLNCNQIISPHISYPRTPDC